MKKYNPLYPEEKSSYQSTLVAWATAWGNRLLIRLTSNNVRFVFTMMALTETIVLQHQVEIK
jgi:hypothetical protein